MGKKNEDTGPVCRRCGTCCRKGGPSFHRGDRVLIDQGKIPVKHLYTIRKGELAHDNVRGVHRPVGTDIIKIKGQPGTWSCVLLDAKTNQCTIYDDRPLECRVLKCWDTRGIEAVYERDRLSRKDLVSGIEGLWELIRDHEKKCAYAGLQDLVANFRDRNGEAAKQKICEVISYDDQIRKRIVAKTALQPDQLDFLFGRPLVQTIPMFGMKCTDRGGRYILTFI